MLKPADFGAEALRLLGAREAQAASRRDRGPGRPEGEADRSALPAPGLGARCKPTVLPSGRIILPLYSDTFSISIMALSDDGGTPGTPASP